MATNLNLNTATMDDIVFETRNKSYGAYVLRKIYGRHVTLASIIGTGLFLLFISAPLIANLLGGEEEEEIVMEQKIVELAEPPSLENKPPPPPPPNLPPPPPPVVSTVKYTPPVIKKDEEVREEEEVPDQKELEDVVISTKTVEGNVKTADVPLEVVEAPSEVGEVVEDKVFTFAEQPSQFPGGEGELQKFLKKNIKYPPAALRNGIEGLVIVQFVVNKEGEISDVQVVKKLGGGTDEEAMRVVKMMPKFTPAKQNGRPVSYRYTLPVRFGLQ